MQMQLFFSPAQESEAFKARLKGGDACDCPVCGRHAQIYRRKFHSSMALQLIRMYQLGGGKEYIHASKLIVAGVSGSGDFSKAKYWDLIFPKPTTDNEESKSNGFWILSDKGEQFVRGEIRIPREVLVFDDKVEGISTETISITEALGTKFNYQELMETHA
jgi:hypothetical protein